MSEGRGTAEFGRISQELYGSASDAFHAGDPAITDLGIMLTESLSNIGNDLGREPRTIAAPEAVAILQAQLDKVTTADTTIRVIESEGNVAYTTSGADNIARR